MITIDFETRSELDLPKAGAWKYSLHQSTKPLCMAWALDEGAVDLWLPFEPVPITIIAAAATGQLFEAHNAFFEYCIWLHIMMPQYDFPPIKTENWRCSQAKTLMHAVPAALAKACKALHLPIQKDEIGKRAMMKLAKPRKPTKHNKDKWHDDPTDYHTMYDYCQDDVRAERCLSNQYPPIAPDEIKVWQLDQKINKRGIHVDMQCVKAALRICDQIKKENNSRLFEITGGAIKTTGQIKVIGEWLAKRHIVTDSLAKDVIQSLLNVHVSVKRDPVAREVLQLRLATAKTSTSKYKAIVAAVADDNRIRGLFKYYGAFTGRWAAKLVQPQNMPRNTYKGNFEHYYKILAQDDSELFKLLYPNSMAMLSSCIRGVLTPGPGKTFYGGDFSQIEPRMACWLAGDNAALEEYRKGVDRYVQIARQVYNKRDINEAERQMGKTIDIGCVYGLGWEGLKATCLRQAGIVVTETFARDAVSTYRESRWLIKAFWKTQLEAAMMAIRTGNRIVAGTRKIQWKAINKHLYCQIPSGRRICYPFVSVKPAMTPWGKWQDTIHYGTVDSQTNQWVETTTHGGKILENIDQALSRDTLVAAMFAVEGQGYEIVLHAHDELLCEKDSGDPEELRLLMQVNLSWAPTLPILVKSWSGKRYLK